ncbi:MAG: transglycosylase SLT domain-containing protein [Calditrichia bacterium]
MVIRKQNILIRRGKLSGRHSLGYWRKSALLLMLVLLGGCGRSDQISEKAEIAADSLQVMVETKIAHKKALQDFRHSELPPDFQAKVENYYPVIRKYSSRYGFDWRLIVLQILKESAFRENARSQVGAMGLMQIMPATATEIRREMDIEYIAINPSENIAGGIYHLYKQLRYFPQAQGNDRLKLALAAYNAGPARVIDAQKIARFKNLDPQSWEAVKSCLPLLTPDSWRLHLDVWELGVPAYGYFYGFRETISYVDEIFRNYQLLTKSF